MFVSRLLIRSFFSSWSTILRNLSSLIEAIAFCDGHGAMRAGVNDDLDDAHGNGWINGVSLRAVWLEGSKGLSSGR
jgi:hypothetical protein